MTAIECRPNVFINCSCESGIHPRSGKTTYVGLTDGPVTLSGGMSLRDATVIVQGPQPGRVLFAESGPAVLVEGGYNVLSGVTVEQR